MFNGHIVKLLCKIFNHFYLPPRGRFKGPLHCCWCGKEYFDLVRFMTHDLPKIIAAQSLLRHIQYGKNELIIDRKQQKELFDKLTKEVL